MEDLLLKYYHDSRDKPGNYFPMPKSIFRLGLTSGEILVYAYLMYCEDRKTFQCHPSFSTIGEAVGMSNNTVKKYVQGLELKGLITTEHTKIKTRDGRVHNGSLLYTLKPIESIEERYFQKVLAEQASKNAVQNALRWYAAYHNAEGHPHVHMLVWSESPHEPYLSTVGIHNIKKTIAADIFRQDNISNYKRQTQARDDLKEQFRIRIAEINREIQSGSFSVSEALVQKLEELSLSLENHKGKYVIDRIS